MNTNENKQETAEQENTAAEEAAAKDTAEQAAEDTKVPEETAEETAGTSQLNGEGRQRSYNKRFLWSYN